MALIPLHVCKKSDDENSDNINVLQKSVSETNLSKSKSNELKWKIRWKSTYYIQNKCKHDINLWRSYRRKHKNISHSISIQKMDFQRIKLVYQYQTLKINIVDWKWYLRIIKYRARLVAPGLSLKCFIECAARISSFRFIIAFTNQNHLIVHAFLN